MKRFIQTFWPPLILGGITLFIALINVKPNTYLIGWDSLIPEFNLGLNIQRSIFAVWQEYQGLGLLGGMGHASDLVRQIILLLLSSFIPVNLLRYTWTMGMLGIGGIGAYFLIFYLLKAVNLSSKSSKAHEIATPVSQLVRNDGAGGEKLKLLALCGSIFYLFNLSTLQTFYVPFEVFTAHFGFLPWLLYSALLYIEKGNKKTLFFASIILLLATPAAYVPTLFVVYLIALSILLGTLLITRYFYSQGLKVNKTIKQVFKLYLLIFLINAFWLLPFLYFTVTNAQVLLNAKINQMSTDPVFFQNKEFGDVFDVMLLRGFWFNNVNPNISGQFVYMLGIWKAYAYNPFIQLLGYVQFGVILIGFIHFLKKRNPVGIALCVLFIFCFTVLAVNTPPFAWIDYLLRTYIPLFHEAFRFTFTKFSLLAALVYGIFFAFGLQQILLLVKNKKAIYIVLVTAACSCIIIVFPIFQGHLFYGKEQRQIPKEYFALFNFFKHQDQNTRIADFPQNEIWGWGFTKWGYEGSGFPWYGIRQPILDRAFDVWSNNNENYYWEVSNALYPPNPQKIQNILNKHQITWLLVDNNVVYPDKPNLGYATSLKKLFSQISGIHKVQTFGNIDVYKFDLTQKLTNYVFMKNNVPSINTYQWNNNDTAYQTYGEYQSQTQNATVYPFRSLFSDKSQADTAFFVEGTKNSLTVNNSVSQEAGNASLKLPQMQNTSIPATVTTSIESNGLLDVTLVFTTPQIQIHGKTLWKEQTQQTVFRIPKDVAYPFHMTINGQVTFPLTYQNKTLGSILIHTSDDTIFLVKEDNQNLTKIIAVPANTYNLPPIHHRSETIQIGNVQKGTRVTLVIPNVPVDVIQPTRSNLTNCNNFRKGTVAAESTQGMLQLLSKNATACTSYYASNMYYDNGYIVTFTMSHQAGQAMHFWMDNPQLRSSPIDTLLPSIQQDQRAQFIITPLSIRGKGYGLHFDENSFGNEETKNSIGTIAIYTLPYDFLTNMTIGNTNTVQPATPVNTDLKVDHPNESLYAVTFSPNQMPHATTLILSQGYDNGWKMYQVNGINWFSIAFPFLFSHEIPSHVMINNWENGWNLDTVSNKNGNTFIIVYLPQYLEYSGFVVLFATFGWIVWQTLRIKHTKKHHKKPELHEN